MRLLLIDKYESWRYVPKISAPVLILRAEHDETIPAASTEALRDRFPAAQVQYVVVPGASHNTIIDDPAYVRAMSAFERAAVKGAALPATRASTRCAPAPSRWCSCTTTRSS